MPLPAAPWPLSTVLVLFLLTGIVPAAAQSAGDYVIGPQDVLSIQVFDQPDLGGQYTVETDGTFSFPLVGRVKAAGLTLRQFEVELKRHLADGFFRNPQVTVGVEQYRSQRVFVVGEVRQPGTYPLTGDMTLIEALARAGSTMPSASGEVVIVRSAGGQGPVLPPADGNGDPPGGGAAEVEVATGGHDVVRVNIRELESGTMTGNIDLRDGDTIFVPRAELVYVFGQVKNPGSYAIQRDITVLQALSLAGGVTPHGATNRIRIVRIVEGRETELRARLSDPVLPGDTIIVPERFF